MMRTVRALSLVAGVAMLGAAASPPPARVVPFSQTFYGTVRTDPYHWMEAGGPDLEAYLRAQTEYTTSVLDANPGRPKLLAAMRAAYADAANAATTGGITRIGTRVYYLQNLPGAEQPSLLVRSDGATKSAVIVDAKTLPTGVVIGWFQPSPDGSKIAYGATESSENVTVHVCDADGSHDVVQAIDHTVIPFAVWHGNHAFYYSLTRESRSDRTEESYLHTIGTPSGADALIAGFGAAGPLGSKTDRDLFANYIVLDGAAVIAAVQHDVSKHQAVYAAPFAGAATASGAWRRIFGFDDEVVSVAAAGRYVYGLTDRGDAHRSILVRDRLTGAAVRTIAPSDGSFRTEVFADRSGLYVTERTVTEMRLARFDLSGKALGYVTIPKVNAVVSVAGDPRADAFTIETSAYNDPDRWYEVRGARAAVSELPESSPRPALYANIVYDDDVAVSADGTRIPYTVIHAKDTPKDGMRPTLALGYGAYGAIIDPPMPPAAAALVNQGVVVVLTHPRGGGEFGEPWHLAGKGPTKQHTIDDFVACAQALIDTGWTQHGKLAGWGTSAGGVLIGNTITQHPDLLAVAIAQVGVTDLVDYEKMPNGPGNVPEFGSVSTESGFRSLLAVSAYDHVTSAPYPATILTTGLNDQRVSPWQVAKMTARLQASTTSGKPVLLRADTQGHGMIRNITTEIDEFTDVFTFMLWQEGVAGFQP